MPHNRLTEILENHVADLEEKGTAKGAESVVTKALPPSADRGPRFHLEGEGEKEFLRMNSNSYLGMSLRPEIMKAEEEGTAKYGAGPGAVRFISGTYDVHTQLEADLAKFHGREDAMIFSSAYATIMGTISPLVTKETAVISDELNHNCIINAVRLSRPHSKVVYPHLDMEALDKSLEEFKGQATRALVITDGIFSMRGDHAPMDEIMALAEKHDDGYPENVVVVMDDSHGVGAFGETGRGTEEYTNSPQIDVLVGTLGKAFGVNGGYVSSNATLIRFLRESAPFYIYSNPITPGEAKAAVASLALLDSPRGRDLLVHLRALTKRFEEGLGRLGMETIPGEHPVVPLMVRDTAKTNALVEHLYANGVLATGLAFPVVPRGDEEIRFQINADHTEQDVDRVLEVLRSF
ncbi:MAG: aminotransferase class I/II-fold pyridoxal phosphate-dependent enzyme [Gemmatimonadetes bacterium]|nr:aminotransferase class I/II-fold pyridoxal phosphate-dependent enzyme [Gemmatimonadota bacterium]